MHVYPGGWQVVRERARDSRWRDRQRPTITEEMGGDTEVVSERARDRDRDRDRERRE